MGVNTDENRMRGGMEEKSRSCGKIEKVEFFGWLKEEVNKMQGSEEVYPFLPCPLCGSDVELSQDDDAGGVWFLECQGCNLFFGLPNGYSSRIDMAADWNKRTTIATVENWTDPNEDWPEDESSD